MTRPSAARRLIGVAAAVFAAFALAPAAQAARDFAHYGHWIATAGHDSSGPFCLMKTLMHDGGTFGIRFDRDGVHMYTYDPRWHLRRPGNVRLALAVDGATYQREGRVMNNHLIRTDAMSRDMFTGLISTKSAVLYIGREPHKLRWNFNLYGTRRTAVAVNRCVNRMND